RGDRGRTGGARGRNRRLGRPAFPAHGPAGAGAARAEPDAGDPRVEGPAQHRWGLLSRRRRGVGLRSLEPGRTSLPALWQDVEWGAAPRELGPVPAPV